MVLLPRHCRSMPTTDDDDGRPRHDPNVKVVRATFNAHSSNCFSPRRRFYEVPILPHFAAAKKKFSFGEKVLQWFFFFGAALILRVYLCHFPRTFFLLTFLGIIMFSGSASDTETDRQRATAIRNGACETKYSNENNYSLGRFIAPFTSHQPMFIFFHIFTSFIWIFTPQLTWTGRMETYLCDRLGVCVWLYLMPLLP